jgi:hypothetical protein
MQVGLTMYVLAVNGALTGINACIVPRAIKRGEETDDRFAFWRAAWLRALEAWREIAQHSVQLVPLGLRVCTWNVGETKPSKESLQRLVGSFPGTPRSASD